jgi:hypothetical protein
MKTRYVVSVISIVCLAALGACKGSEPSNANQPPSQTQTQPKAESAPPVQAEQFVAGELQQIDADAMTVVLKDVQGTEQKFRYSPATRITGIASVAELARQEGRHATIRFVERENLKSAVMIHVETGS